MVLAARGEVTMHRFLASHWNEPFLLIGCIGDMMNRVGDPDATAFIDTAIRRRLSHALWQHGNANVNGVVPRTWVKRFAHWATHAFDNPFVISDNEAREIEYGILSQAAGRFRLGRDMPARLAAA